MEMSIYRKNNINVKVVNGDLIITRHINNTLKFYIFKK